MHILELTAPEQRVLGCLIEKRFTTPDQYPLTLNALRLACNQSTNRDPVTRYDEETVRQAAQRLTQYGVARLASGHSSRATKYRHLAEEALSADQEQLAVLCVLLLRGPQTPGELKARTERMVAFAALEEVDRVLEELCERGYARPLERRPGQKEERFQQVLGGNAEGAGAGEGGAQDGATDAPQTRSLAPRANWSAVNATVEPAGAATSAPAGQDTRIDTGATAGLAARIGKLETELAELRRDSTAQLAALRDEIAALRLLWDDALE